MTLKDNKLTPSGGMHLQRVSDGSIYEGETWIPLSLTVDDFKEITHKEYLQIIQQNKPVDDIASRISKLEEQSENNTNEITGLREGLNILNNLLKTFRQFKGE